MTVGKPTRVAMRDSMINKQCNNFSMKLPGLVPSATGYYIPSGQAKLNKFFPNVNYVLTRSCNHTDWKYKPPPHGPGGLLNLTRNVVLSSKVNGNHVIM